MIDFLKLYFKYLWDIVFFILIMALILGLVVVMTTAFFSIFGVLFLNASLTTFRKLSIILSLPCIAFIKAIDEYNHG